MNLRQLDCISKACSQASVYYLQELAIPGRGSLSWMSKHHKIQKIRNVISTDTRLLHQDLRPFTLPLHVSPSLVSSQSTAHPGFQPHSSPPPTAGLPCSSHLCGFSYIVPRVGNSFPHFLHLVDIWSLKKTCSNSLSPFGPCTYSFLSPCIQFGLYLNCIQHLSCTSFIYHVCLHDENRSPISRDRLICPCLLMDQLMHQTSKAHTNAA